MTGAGAAHHRVLPGKLLCLLLDICSCWLVLHACHSSLLALMATLRSANLPGCARQCTSADAGPWRCLLCLTAAACLLTALLQGKTSRWALAWSFIADPSAATKPLPRFPAALAAAGAAASGSGSTGAARPAPVAALRPQRKLSWQVHAAAADGPALLDAIQRCLQQAGVQCKVNRSSYSVAGSYAPTPAEQEAASEAAAAGRATKRRRGDGGGDSEEGSGEQGSKPGSSAAAWPLELHLYWQHAGLFLLTAATKAPEGAVAWFARLMQQVQAGLGAHWKLQT